MSENKKKIDGLRVEKDERKPDFVLTTVSFNVEKFNKWLDENKNAKGWVNLDLKKNTNGDYYLDYYKPKESVPF